MNDDPLLTYKIATEAHEFEQIHRLNYRTFVEEIPQHAPNPEKRLVDRFHDENTYIICVRNGELMGMIALRGRRPFSLDSKLPDLDAYLPPNSNPLEIRLLAIDPRCRKTGVLFRLMRCGVDMARARNYDIAVISGTTRQIKLYEHVGFRPFGPLVGTADAMFQPMYLTWDAFDAHGGALLERKKRLPQPVNLLPGPVELSREVQNAFVRPPISHRSEEFMLTLAEVKAALCRLTGAREVAVLQGSGTLANDVIAGQLSLSDRAGVILSNGEFGERLCDHANRFQLDYAAYATAWGQPLELDEVDRLVAARPQVGWLWAVHCETSTGVLNDLAALKQLSRRHGLKLCMDCVSSIGGVEVDLSSVHLASATIGKAIGAPPGLSMVFTDGDVAPPGRLPRYLDLASYLAPGVPFTMSSNLLAALRAALAAGGPKRQAAIAHAGRRLRDRLEESGVEIVAPRSICAPHILTIKAPAHSGAAALAGDLEKRGVLVAHASEYLERRNWVQVCLMREYTAELVDRIALILAEEMGARTTSSFEAG